MIINLTPHDVCIFSDDGMACRVIPASGNVARLTTQTVRDGYIDGIPVTKTVFGDVENLPAPEDGTVYIVSSLVAQRCKDRDDVFVPNESVRDVNGKIVGCKSLGKI